MDQPRSGAAVRAVHGQRRAAGRYRARQGAVQLGGKVITGSTATRREGAERNIARALRPRQRFLRRLARPDHELFERADVGDDGLEAAQDRKCEAIAERLGNPETVLEIGCGWGALAATWRRKGAKSPRSACRTSSWPGRGRTHPEAGFRKQDYRDVTGQFDAIVSVEMVEALGANTGRPSWTASRAT